MTSPVISPALTKGPGARQAQDLLQAQPQKGWVDLVRQYGNTFVFQGVLATCEPALVNQLLSSRMHTQKRSVVYKLMSRLVPGAPGVLFMDGPQWQHHVTAVMPVFKKAQVGAYTQTIHQTVRACMAGWREGQCFEDLYRVITDIGLEVVLRVGYGLDPQLPLARQYGQELRAYKDHTMRTKARLDDFGFSWNQVRLLPAFFKSRRTLSRQVRRQRQLVRQLLEQRQAQGNLAGKDWFSLLHRACLPLPQLSDELNHIYGAFNAIDYALTCALYELSRHPPWACLIRQELQQVLGDRPFPRQEDFGALHHTMNFMKEVFRYYPVALAVLRRTGQELPLSGTTWPKGKEVMILLQSLHHHPDFWEQPELFEPNRWNKPLQEPLAYLPFLTGPRQCIGKHLAQVHFVVTLNAILQQFSIRVLDHAVPVKPFMNPRFARNLPFVLDAPQGL